MDAELFLGQHYIAEFYDCAFQKLDDPTQIEKNFLQCAQLCNATIICSKFHHFNPFGVSGVVVIAESHMTVHTWPQFRYAAVDVFTCSTKMKSHKCIEVLKEKFKCPNSQSTFLPRGFVQNLHISPEQIEKQREIFINAKERVQEIKQQKLDTESWIYEQGTFSKFGIPYDKMLYNKKSEFQDIKIVQSPSMGRTLLLDNVFMICEKTEENYHEMMVHPSVQVLLQKGKKVLDVLIIGGGDGGAARQLLRYPQVNKIKVAELDGDVIESCRQFIPKTAKSFDDPKVEIAVGDGLAYVANTTETWDLILCDGCDPIGEGCNLFSDSFYKNCHKILKDDGIFLTQGQSPYAYQQQFIKTHNHLKDIFGKKNTSLLFYHQPIYEFGMWSFQLASKSEESFDLKEYSRRNLNEAEIEEFVEANDLKYYNFDIHLSSMAMPTHVRKLLRSI